MKKGKIGKILEMPEEYVQIFLKLQLQDLMN